MDEIVDKQHLPETATTQAPETALQPPLTASATDTTKQRRYPRIKCFLAVQLRPADDQSLRLGKLSDVSLGGCGVESVNPVSVGTNVALCPLAADGTLWVQGAVVNTQLAESSAGYRIGIRFLEGDASAPTHNVKEFVRFVEQAAAKQEPQDSYLHRLARGQF